MMSSIISTCYPSEEVSNLVTDADEEHLDVLEWGGSEMLEDAIQTCHRIEANEGVTRVTEWFHSFVDQLVLVTLHSDFEGLSVFVFSWDAAFAHWFFHTHQHLEVLEVLDLCFNMQLLSKVRND